jgi:hypothetical protein
MNTAVTIFLRLLRSLFSNNGVARGTIYWFIGVLTPWPAALMSWDAKPPGSGYVVAAAIISSILAGLVNIRAYMDQHLSRNKNADAPKQA